MTNPAIHPTAIVDPGSEIGEGVTIGPYAIVEKGAVVGNHCSIEAHAIIKGEARIGSHCLVGHFSVLGGLPQHNSFDPSIRSYAKIGERVRIGGGRYGSPIHLFRRLDRGGGCFFSYGVFPCGS